MPLTLICRRCNTNVQTDDRFCQECGFDLKTANTANASPVVPHSGNNFDFSPTENNQFEWPSLVEDPAAGNAKAFSTPALDRKFSRYRDKEPNWKGSETADQVEPSGEQADVTESGELRTYASVETQVAQNELQAQSIPPQSHTETHPIATLEGATTESLTATTDSMSATDAGAETAIEAAEPGTISNTTLSEKSIAASESVVTMDATTTDTTVQVVKRLHSPLLEKEIAQKKPTQSKGRPVFIMDAAAIVAVLAFATALGVWGYNNYSKSELANGNKKAAVAQIASKNNELLASYKSLFALSILSQKGLDANQQATFDDVAFRLGQEAFSAGKVTEAQDYLKNVSVASAKYSKAQELIKSAQTGATTPSTGDSSAANQQANKTSRRELDSNSQRTYSPAPNAQSQNKQLSERRVLSIPVLPELEAQSTSIAEEEEPAVTGTSEEPAKTGNGLVIEMAGDANSNADASQAPSSASSTGGVLSFSPENAIREGRPRRKRQAASNASGSSHVSTKIKAQDEPTPKFSESEISVYNRLLGRFIAAHGQKAAQSEPPSFKEWIRKGKPAF